MFILIYILLATIIVSLISLIGIIFIGIKQETFDKVIEYLVSFAIGGLLGGAFIHLLPESIELGNIAVCEFVLSGIIIFFIIEKVFHWRHCHRGHCDVHAFAYLNLLGDSIHNFVDGLIIAGSFVVDIKLGIVTTMAVLIHEIPQEMGDYGILVYGGFSKVKALIFNLFSALTAIVGGIIGYYTSEKIEWLKYYLIPFTAGGFIYIALVDMIPELHKKNEGIKSAIQFLCIFMGLSLMWGLKLIFEH